LKPADGIIFDFNGTLLWDNEENRKAWSDTALFYRGRPLSDAEFTFINGKSDRAAASLILGEADEKALLDCENYKEALYKELCLKSGITLTDGAVPFIKSLREKDYRLSIASSAPKCNMDWYIPAFRLHDFFAPDAIIAGRTDIKGKPAPDIFLLAAEAMGLDISRCVVFEDSLHGIAGARAAGASMIVAVACPGADIKETSKHADMVISGFRSTALSLFIC
jgi:haloacid dehalogenase superfamily, subfamily IA, variant 3 with third motif having DD or ED